MPREASARRESLDALARCLFEGLSRGDLSACLVSREQLDGLVQAEARFRMARAREASLVRGGQVNVAQGVFRGATYAGFCAQGAREEAPGKALGLVEPGWVLERILIVASARGTRSATWLEGSFVYTRQGWRGLDLRRVELPRPRHSDLELAPCDVESGLR
jgi:hypothetical protein